MKLKKVKDGTETTYDIEASLDKINGINGTASDINQKLGKIEETYTAAEKAKVNAIPNDPKYTDTVYDDTNIKNRITGVEDKLNGSGSVTFSNLTTTNLTTNGEIEIYGATQEQPQPHIDFHYYGDSSNDDYTSRIIETTSGKIDILADNGLFVNGSKVQTKNNLESIALGLSIYDKNLRDFSYTIKYVPVIPAVFVRFYGIFDKNLTNQTGGVKIIGFPNDFLDKYKPNYQTALSVHSSKKITLVAKSDGIYVNIMDTGLLNYAVWGAGFWFV